MSKFVELYALRGRRGCCSFQSTCILAVVESTPTVRYRGGPCQRDRILDRISDPIFGSYPATLFSQQRAYKLANLAGPYFGVQNLAPKVGALSRRNGFAAPVLGSEIWTPKRGPTNVVFFPHFWAFQRAPSTPSDVAKHVGRNARALPSLTTPLLRQLAHHHHNAHRGARPDFGPDFGPYFWVLPSDFFSQQRAYKLANVSHTLVSKVETIAVCERERVAHVCCAALAQCMPVHAHCGAHACSVPQEERKSQCTICQCCNLKLPRRCQSNTQFCALCRFGRQTWSWEGACAYGLFATL